MDSMKNDQFVTPSVMKCTYLMGESVTHTSAVIPEHDCIRNLIFKDGCIVSCTSHEFHTKLYG
eukprot:4738939-Amphidinium_carterae.1